MRRFLVLTLTAAVLAIPAYAEARTPAAHHAALPNPFTPFTPPVKPVPGNLQTITVDDLKNALADANAQIISEPACSTLPQATNTPCMPAPYNASVTGGDTRHANCWAALIDFVGQFQAQNILPEHPGLALLQQKIFDDQKLTTKNLIPDYVAHACVDTFNDANKNLADIINALGLKAVTLPAIP